MKSIAFGMADYRKLLVWQRSAKFAVEIFEVADKIKVAGHFRLSEQLKSAAESIGSNIAEGSAHDSRKEFGRYLGYSIASSCELESQLRLSCDVKAIAWNRHEELAEEVAAIRKMLRRLRQRMDE